MRNAITWVDRLRIERAVWTLDQRLYDLPRRSRIARRRELRENLLSAAHDVGAVEALRRLGDNRQLASEYLSAELGDGPRHSWIAAATFASGALFLLNWVLSEATLAFGDGIARANPNATGTFTWGGIELLQHKVTYTFVGGSGTYVGGAWTPACWVAFVGGTVLVGRLWRALPIWIHRRAKR